MNPSTATRKTSRLPIILGGLALLLLLLAVLLTWLAISRPALWLPILNRQLPAGMVIVAAEDLRPGPGGIGWQRIELRWHEQTMELGRGHASWQIHRLRPLDVELQHFETRALLGRLAPPVDAPREPWEPLPRFWEQPWWPILSALSGDIQNFELRDHQDHPVVSGSLKWREGAREGRAALAREGLEVAISWTPEAAAIPGWQVQWQTLGAMHSDGVATLRWQDNELSFRMRGTLDELPAGVKQVPFNAEGQLNLFAAVNPLLITQWEVEGRQPVGDTPVDWHCYGSLALHVDLELLPELSHCELTSLPVAGKLLGPIALDWQSQALQWQNQLELKLVGPFVSGVAYIGGTGCTLGKDCELPLHLELYSGSWEGWSWGGGSANTSLSYAAGDSSLQLGVTSVELSELTGAGIRVPELSLQSDGLTLWQPDLNSWQTERVDWHGVAELQEQELELTLRGHLAEPSFADKARWSTRLELAADLRWQNQSLPTLYLDQQWRGEEGAITGSGELESGMLGTLLRHRITVNEGEPPHLAGRIDSADWPEGVDIPAALLGNHAALLPVRELHGSINADVAARWGDRGPRIDLNGRLDDMAGLYEQYAFAGAAATPFHLRWDDTGLKTVTPLHWQVRAFNVGVEITNLQGSLTLDPTAWQLGDVSGELLGGRFDLERFDLEDGGLVKVAGIDLAAAVGLMNQPDIQATGQLSGELPVALENGAPVVRQGRVRNDVPGTIRYRPGPDSDFLRGNPQTALVGDTLSNLHYERLEAEVSYRANGDLLLLTRLEGRNPDLVGSPPIHLNLNVEQNIPSLLRSLRAGEDISEWLERRVAPRR